MFGGTQAYRQTTCGNICRNRRNRWRFQRFRLIIYEVCTTKDFVFSSEMEPGLRVTGQRVTGSVIWVGVGSGQGSKPWAGFLTRIRYRKRTRRMQLSASQRRVSCADTVSDTPSGPELPAYRAILGHNWPNYANKPVYTVHVQNTGSVRVNPGHGSLASRVGSCLE